MPTMKRPERLVVSRWGSVVLSNPTPLASRRLRIPWVSMASQLGALPFGAADAPVLVDVDEVPPAVTTGAANVLDLGIKAEALVGLARAAVPEIGDGAGHLPDHTQSPSHSVNWNARVM